MSFTLDDVFGKIAAYDKIQKDFSFSAAGTGDRAWSHKFVNPAGELLNVRSTDWALYHTDGEVLAEGTKPADLKRFLLSRLSHEELLEYASKA